MRTAWYQASPLAKVKGMLPPRLWSTLDERECARCKQKLAVVKAQVAKQIKKGVTLRFVCPSCALQEVKDSCPAAIVVEFSEEGAITAAIREHEARKN